MGQSQASPGSGKTDGLLTGRSRFAAALGTTELELTNADDRDRSAAAPVAAIVSLCQARILSWMLVKSLSSGVAARPARIRLRSTYTMQLAIAASSSKAWHLKRDSQKRPLTLSSLFAARAMDSFSRPINQLMLQRRLRSSAIRSGQ